MTISGGKIGVFAICVGLLLPVASCMATGGTYLPYQDPTPEMLSEHAEAVARADLMTLRAMAAGALLVLTGVALLAYKAVRRRRAERRTIQSDQG
ncbi:hypothetical protein HTZ77_20905 [Nonomuraea sp. SMC257]|uniref:Uncharacterized protein n=1 Tax=Nonomuraea montanisoli TaxID=2741721 RepID=A0A7Y6M444_9ACTN|nr:hypothetical protein [Nonomuraea montanisoli]NUW33872.1 hypothetical protein [Nonomuraea montanisoli]